MTQAQEVNPAGPLALPYRDPPRGEVAASDAALGALRQSRPWAMLFAVALFVYAAAGGVIGTICLVTLLANRGQPGFPVGAFIVLSAANLLFSPIALVGGVLAMRYTTAAGRAFNGRSSRELERALVAQKHVWRWAGVAVMALFALPLIVMFVAGMMDMWP